MPALIRVLNLYICPLTHLFCYKCVVRLNMHPNIQTHMEYTWNIYEYSILKSIHSSRAFSIHKHHSHRCLQPPHFLCQQPRALILDVCHISGPSSLSITLRLLGGRCCGEWRVWMVGVIARPSMGCSGITTTKVGSENWAANHHPEIPEASCEPCRISGPL